MKQFLTLLFFKYQKQERPRAGNSYYIIKEIKIMDKDIILIYDAFCWSFYQNMSCAFNKQFVSHMILGKWN